MSGASGQMMAGCDYCKTDHCIPTDFLVRLSNLQSRLQSAVYAVEDYGWHEKYCILNLLEEGEPTEDGGYRQKYKGKWYQARPIDETPKCDCGFAKILAQIREPK